MGYSCTAAASDTERQVLSAVCLEQTGLQNTYVGTDGIERFYEPSRVEHPDGAITGSVWRLIDGLAHPSGNFRIGGDGTITRWPSHFPRNLVGTGMTYDAQLIEEGLCPDLVWIDTEDGRVDGRCMAPIVPGGYACPGHTAEREQWRSMSEIDKAEWERRQDAEPW